MSQWSHVAGCIRIDALLLDGLQLDGTDIVSDLKSRFGKTCEYESPPEDWDACNVPCGSEGSVQYRVQRTGDDSDLAWGLVYIWGDLRDYDDAQEIYAWLNRACRGLIIRMCSVKVDVEGRNSFIICDGEDDVLIMEELKASCEDLLIRENKKLQDRIRELEEALSNERGDLGCP